MRQGILTLLSAMVGGLLFTVGMDIALAERGHFLGQVVALTGGVILGWALARA